MTDRLMRAVELCKSGPSTITPEDIIKTRERLNVSQSLLGDALGFSDAGRTIRGWEHGERNGKTYAPSGSARAALGYLEAIVAACDRLVAGEEVAALNILRESLPEEMR